MIGRRMPDGDPFDWPPGAYGRFNEHGWYACTPNGLLANLSRHDFTEHVDGTITISPSIEVTSPGNTPDYWHGWLKAGIWSQA